MLTRETLKEWRQRFDDLNVYPASLVRQLVDSHFEALDEIEVLRRPRRPERSGW